MTDDERKVDEDSPESRGVNLAHGSLVNQFIGRDVTVHYGSVKPDASEDTERSSFFYDFLAQALKQAEMTFRLSLIFMSAGALIILVGGGLALANAGNQDWSYPPVLTSLSGLLISSCGGAFALHANRARKHLTEQANVLREEMRSDTLHARTLALIDRVEDKDLRDRLKSLAAIQILGVESNSDAAVDRVLPIRGEGVREIDPEGR